MTRSAVLSLVVAALVAGCGSDETERTAPPLVPPPGYTVVADSDASFSIAIPEDWVILPLFNLKIFGDASDRLAQQDPDLSGTLERGKLFVGRGQLFAFDPADKGASTVGLIASDAGADEKLEVVAKQAGEYLTQGGATGFTSEGAILAGGPAIKATFTQSTRTPQGMQDVVYTQYYMLRSGRSYVLTLTGTGPELETITQSLKIA